MSENECSIQAGPSGSLPPADLHQEPSVIATTTRRANEDSETRPTEHGHGTLEKSCEYQLLETISNTLKAQNELMVEQKNAIEAQNKLMVEQKDILEAVTRKYKVPQSESFLR